MKYIAFNSKDNTIVTIYETLRELMKAFPDIDVSDYVDDLEEHYQDKYFVSEEYLGDLLSNNINNDNDTSLKDVISLREDLDDLQESYAQANNEIENVHKQYVSLSEENKLNKETIVKYEKTISELESLRDTLKTNIDKLEKDITDINKTNQKNLNLINANLGSVYKDDLLKVATDLITNVESVRKELNEFKGGSLHE